MNRSYAADDFAEIKRSLDRLRADEIQQPSGPSAQTVALSVELKSPSPESLFFTGFDNVFYKGYRWVRFYWKPPAWKGKYIEIAEPDLWKFMQYCSCAGYPDSIVAQAFSSLEPS